MTASKTASAFCWLTRANAAAPKIARDESCPVRPNGMFSIIAFHLEYVSAQNTLFAIAPRTRSKRAVGQTN